jgi:peptidoglycan/LPS O-acetylase OafA/YrhL
MISGYYMSMVLNGAYAAPGFTRRFYAARYLRLFPQYAVVAILTICFWHYADPARIATPQFTAMPLTWLFTVSANASIFGLDILKLITVQMPQPYLPRLIGPGWSLGIELLFYVVAPFVVRRHLKVSIALFSILLAIRLFMLPFAYDPWRYYFAPSVLCFFWLGHIAERLGTKLPDSLLVSWIGAFAIIFLPFAGYFTGVNIVRDIDRPDTWAFLLLFAAALPFIFAATRRSKLDTALGSLSYPLYLVHQLALVSVGYLFGSSTASSLAVSPVRTILGLCFTFLAAYGLLVVVEKPLEGFRQRFRSKAPSTSAKHEDEQLLVDSSAPRVVRS